MKEGVRGRNRSRREKHRKVTGEGRKVRRGREGG